MSRRSLLRAARLGIFGREGARIMTHKHHKSSVRIILVTLGLITLVSLTARGLSAEQLSEKTSQAFEQYIPPKQEPQNRALAVKPGWLCVDVRAEPLRGQNYDQ